MRHNEGAAGGMDIDARARQLAPMLSDADARVRKSAVVALGRMGCPVAVDLLCRALDDADEGVGVLACQALGRLADPACLDAVLSHTRDASPQMRSGVLWVLANVAAHGGLADQARSELFGPIVMLAFDPDDGVRADAAAVLGTVPDPRSVDPLLVLSEDDVERVRGNALASLGLVGGARGEGALVACVEADGTASLPLVSALDALARRAERGELGAGDDHASRSLAAALRLAADAGDPDVRSTAVWALGPLARACPAWRDRAVGLLGSILEQGGDESWAWRYAVESLARIGGDDVASMLAAARSRLDEEACGDGAQSAALLDQALVSLRGE